MPPRRRPITDPRLQIMPNFASQGYAPSRARKRRQHNCDNEQAIQLLQNEWQERQDVQIRLWDQEHPNPPGTPTPPRNPVNNTNPQDNSPEPEQRTIQATPEQLDHNVEELVNSLNNAQEHQHTAQNAPPTNANQDAQHSQLQSHPTNLEQQLAQLVASLQQAQSHSFRSDQTLNNASDATSSSTSLASKIKLGRDVHDVMKDCHVLPLTVLEELRNMRHVKLWFFTNDSLEKTQSAKEKSARYNTARVTFDFEKQGLVAENEYEATLKNAPEDNTLSPDQLNQAMPRFIDSIRHAGWPSDIISMLERFFQEVQRHYEARSRPIAGFYTLSQAVFELRNKFHAHIKHHKEALILSLDPAELDHIREQLKAARDDSHLLLDAYRTSQREAARKRELIANTFAGPSNLLPQKRSVGADIKNIPGRVTKPRNNFSSSPAHFFTPLPTPKSLPSAVVSAPITDFKPVTAGKSVSPSSSSAANVNMGPSMSAQLVAVPLMDRQLAVTKRKSKPLHPFNLHYISNLFRDTPPLQNKYSTLLHSFQHGFLVGVTPVKQTFVPPNSESITVLYSEFVELVNKEFHLQRYLGPFSSSELHSLIGPFQTSPLSLVPKPNSTKFRLIQNLSYPHTNLPVSSINSNIDSASFPCTFGTFYTICLIVNSLPPLSQVSTRDVADAYRTIPLHPSQWPGLVVRTGHDHFVLNTQNSFGLASAGGVWGHVADFLADTFRAHGIGPLSKWVDDYIFFRIPRQHLSMFNNKRSILRRQLTPTQHNARLFYAAPPQPDGSFTQLDDDLRYPLRSHSCSFWSYTEQDIDQLSTRLGLPWKAEKTTPFSSQGTYLGFIWNLDNRTVSLLPAKQNKYIQCIKEWLSRTHHNLLQVQSLYGKLLHVTYIVPEGRLYLTGFERMVPTFHSKPNQPHRPVKCIADDLQWWLTVLTQNTITRSIPQFTSFTPLLAFSDASNKGLGLVINNCWAAFSFSKTFRQRNRDIAWAEAVAVELLLLALDYFPLTTKRIILNCDNTVVSEGWKIGRSRNRFVNDVFKRISKHLQPRHLQLQIQYVASQDNPADPPSRLLTPNLPHLPFFNLPSHLCNDFIREFQPHLASDYTCLRTLSTTELLPEPPNDYYPEPSQLLF
ncbi:reverse transcriptase ribonuclease H [Pyrrhoderma noxium]|uniref:Reverse transcriptase ribonuclease H n=1 Tax=Pyrrhoderma noxium TaxID=2282107 RepID=A0A286UEB8_9AGAM|nr:reverse transcriptase ribonuclease H [Pyrrhoderma noxium]